MSTYQTKICNEYLRKEEQLYAKKERLFNEGNITNWNLNSEDVKGEEGLKVQTNKELAMKLMLPKETEKLKGQNV